MILVKKIEDKSIVWLSQSNQYIVVENIVADILSLLSNSTPKKEVINFLFNQINIPYQQAENFVSDIENLLNQPKNEEQLKQTSELPKSFGQTKYYKINEFVFFIQFSSEYELSLIHPKFAHLEINQQEKFDFNYQVFSKGNTIYFYVNNEFINSWKKTESHYFQGKFSMKIIEHTHQNPEDKWMGIFHASAVSDNNKSMLFLGDSGNGKSTSLALLQANGFTCLADDFVPVLAKTNEVYSFPSAISIKKNSVPVLLSMYPELATTAEYHFKALNKIVRYLPPKNNDYSQHKKCTSLVFIKYVPESDIQINQISSLNAFEKLVPDSWLSPHAENAKAFLDWFENLTCYKLTYSDNKKMIDTVTKLFSDEL
ncbi:hypothetical protein [Tenacibaculum sp. 190524A02b]|uniref:hypothetical protein n=1 Tax=Tenacibaculum vairaonense TaxID=3137860 RepID=UPI0031FB59AD